MYSTFYGCMYPKASVIYEGLSCMLSISVMSYRKVTGHMILVLDQWMAF